MKEKSHHERSAFNKELLRFLVDRWRTQEEHVAMELGK